MRKPRGLDRDWRLYLGAGTPPREAPQGLWEGAHTARERPPGTHTRGKKSKEVYNYISIQVYSIHYTVYSTWVQYTVYKGYSIQLSLIHISEPTRPY